MGSRVSRYGRGLIAIAALLFVVDAAGLVTPWGPLSFLTPLASMEFIAVSGFTGLGLVAASRVRTDGGFSTARASLSIDRSDIVSQTDWARIGKYTLRRSFGVAVAVSATALLVVSLALQRFDLVALWVFLLVVAAVVVAVTWRTARPIVEDYTRTVSVRVPNQFAAHSFHVALRQKAEDLGYKTQSAVSPTEGGSTSRIDDSVLHAKGGFQARHRPIAESRTLVPEFEEDLLSAVLTVSTLGVFSALLGFMLTQLSSLGFAGVVVGVLLFVVGVIVIAYDYVVRSREWAELYCVEEGTVHSTTVSKYGDDTLESMDGHVEPTVTSPETSAVLSVTVGAKCTSLYDEDALRDDFEALTEVVDDAAEDYKLDVTASTPPRNTTSTSPSNPPRGD
jgi:hypothetical protein